MIETLRVDFVGKDDKPMFMVFNLDVVAMWGVLYVPKKQRKPAFYQVVIELKPRQIPNPEGHGVVDHCEKVRFDFDTFDDAQRAVTHNDQAHRPAGSGGAPS